jgi:hypothetical protein
MAREHMTSEEEVLKRFGQIWAQLKNQLEFTGHAAGGLAGYCDGTVNIPAHHRSAAPAALAFAIRLFLAAGKELAMQIGTRLDGRHEYTVQLGARSHKPWHCPAAAALANIPV